MNDRLDEIAEQWRPDGSLAGAHDRSWTERQAARAVIGHLAGEGWHLRSVESPPQPQLSPDVVAVLGDGRRVGVEVTELCDERSVERARAVKKGRKATHIYRIWDTVSIQTKLCGALRKKDQKRRTALLCNDGKRHAWGDPLDEYLIVVHTDEPLIGVREADAALRQMAPPALSHKSFLPDLVRTEVGRSPSEDLRDTDPVGK